ncbi:hypothetical protein AB832_07365 [Flavobacteriaceae bacterium (ex Bugula neritina AB1)]|nr:hypothetical protein AB832_07365 [Flavobacteriaceae bacterium (ex Bugula neritina AB1)]
MNIEDFYTAPAHNAGRRIPLYAPDGSKTEHWLEVLGVDSDSYQKASLNMQRDLSVIKEEVDREDLLHRYKNKLLASLISDWSFDQECTDEEKEKLLKNAPLIAKEVDLFASNRDNFLKKK